VGGHIVSGRFQFVGGHILGVTDHGLQKIC